MVPTATIPSAQAHRVRLRDVLPGCLEALAARRGALGLAPVTHAVVLLVDGLGADQLRAHRAHARGLAAHLDRGETASPGFPTTTAAALASLTTGRGSGEHGLVGYSALAPETGRVVNLLSGWNTDGDPTGPDPDSWQRRETLFESAAPAVTSTVIASERFAGSGFTRAVLRGARFRGGRGLADRIELLRAELGEPGPRLIYVYVPELDVAGHAAGIDSLRWTAALEDVEGFVAEAAGLLGAEHGMLVTADHGMVDVPAEAHRVIRPELLEGVAQLAGEPRALQLHLEPGEDPAEHAARWRAAEGPRAWVATRAEAVAAGWFGEVDDEVLPRIGDLLVLARKAVAYYREAGDPARGMIGQHGSLTAAEAGVPLLRYGAWER